MTSTSRIFKIMLFRFGKSAIMVQIFSADSRMLHKAVKLLVSYGVQFHVSTISQTALTSQGEVVRTRLTPGAPFEPESNFFVDCPMVSVLSLSCSSLSLQRELKESGYEERRGCNQL